MTTDLDAAIRAKLAGDHPIGHCPGCESGDPCDVELGNAAARAVVAVLDRHQPGEGVPSKPVVCGCSVEGDEFTMWQYPCPTVRAIADKLGVDRDRP